MTDQPFDVFVSYASEDRDYPVRVLVAALSGSGISVWHDETEIRIGDGLRGTIDRGLANSRYGIVVLSKHFLKKQWPQWELDGLVQRQMNGNKVILPLWHDVSASEIAKYSPSLANIVAARTDLGFGDVFAKLFDVLRRDCPQPESATSEVHTDSKRVIVSRLSALDHTYSQFRRMLRERDGSGIKRQLLDNPHLLKLFLRADRVTAIQTLVPVGSGRYCDAMALYVPQWSEATFIKLCSVEQPPIVDGIWSVEFADAVGLLAGISHRPPQAVVDIVNEIGETAHDGLEPDDPLSLRRFSGGWPHKTKFVIVAGRMKDKSSEAWRQLHAALPDLELRSYDSLIGLSETSSSRGWITAILRRIRTRGTRPMSDGVRSSALHVSLERAVELIAVPLAPMERKTIHVDVDVEILRQITTSVILAKDVVLGESDKLALVSLRLIAHIGDERSDVHHWYHSYQRDRDTSFEVGISDSGHNAWRIHSEWSDWIDAPKDGVRKILDIWGPGLVDTTVVRLAVSDVAYQVRK